MSVAAGALVFLELAQTALDIYKTVQNGGEITPEQQAALLKNLDTTNAFWEKSVQTRGQASLPLNEEDLPNSLKP